MSGYLGAEHPVACFTHLAGGAAASSEISGT